MFMRMNNKKLLIPLFLFGVICSLYLASATLTVVRPGTSATAVGTYALNVSGMNNILNCTWYVGSTSTANSSWTQVAFYKNTTGGATSAYNATAFVSTIIEDSTDYVFNATCTNTTNVKDSGTVTGITVDNTVPVAPTSLSPTSDTDGSISFSATVTGARTTGCTLIFPDINPGSPTYTMTHSGGTCTYSLSGVAEQTYQYVVRASDGTNTTDSSTVYLLVDEGDNVHGSGQVVGGAGTAPMQKILPIVIIIVLVLLGVKYAKKR